MTLAIVENHGKVFGSENWYMFYCGKCHCTIITGDKKCQYCGEEITYPAIPSKEQEK